MKQTFDTDEILFGILKGNSALVASLSGGIYNGERPLNSVKEDIVINTITLSQDSDPQLGSSNINIHVPDKVISIAGVQQNVEDKQRIKTLSALVLDLIRNAKVSGLTMIVDFQTTVNEPEIKQHFSNIRISWNIHN